MTSTRTLTVLAVIATFAGCRQQDNIVQLRVINQGLVRANQIANEASDVSFHTLDQRMTDPQAIQLIKPWYPAALRVRTLSREMQATIDGMDSLVYAQHGLSSAAKNSFFDSLVVYRKNLLGAFDSCLRAQNRDYITKDVQEINRHNKVLPGYADADKLAYAEKWIDSVLGSPDPMVTRLALNKIKNDIALEENERTRYVESISMRYTDAFERYSPVVRIEPDDVRVGQQIEVSAGIIGGYIDLPKLQITIDSVPTPINNGDRTMASRLVRACEVPGRYTIPVMIEMSFRDGGSNRIVKMMSYHVHK